MSGYKHYDTDTDCTINYLVMNNNRQIFDLVNEIKIPGNYEP
jgi:hypothetical protein